MRYAEYRRRIDVDAFEEAIGFEPKHEGVNKRGEPEDIGQCPDLWHLHKNGDTTGKFAINREQRIYGCFVCGGGTLLDLAMAVRGINEQEAESWLAQFAQSDGASADQTFLSEIKDILCEEHDVKPVMPYYNEHVLDNWVAQVGELAGWLDDRGISAEVAYEARIGYDPLAVRLPPGKAAGEPYRGQCAYLPHFWEGHLVGWQQRWLADRPRWLPKYTNTSGFPKTDTLFNYENVYLSERPIIVCESVPTVLMLRSLGFPAVGTFGAALSNRQLELLRLFNQGLVLAPDNDEPGMKWIRSSADENVADYLARYVPVRVIEPVGGPGNDLADRLLDRFMHDAMAEIYNSAQYY